METLDRFLKGKKIQKRIFTRKNYICSQNMHRTLEGKRSINPWTKIAFLTQPPEIAMNF